MINHEEDADWKCDGDPIGEECSFQTNEKQLLENHIREKHHTAEILTIKEVEEIQNKTNEDPEKNKQQSTEIMIKCPFCENNFKSKTALARHRQDVHPTYKPCRNIESC